MPAVEKAALIARISASSRGLVEGRELALLAEAGFRDPTRFVAALHMNS
jgi:hypothetical protein